MTHVRQISRLINLNLSRSVRRLADSSVELRFRHGFPVYPSFRRSLLTSIRHTRNAFVGVTTDKVIITRISRNSKEQRETAADTPRSKHWHIPPKHCHDVWCHFETACQRLFCTIFILPFHFTSRCLVICIVILSMLIIYRWWYSVDTLNVCHCYLACREASVEAL